MLPAKGSPIRNLSISLALFRLDYCNAALTGSPQVLLDKIQRVINCSARFICKARESAHIIPLRSPLAVNQQLESIQNSSRLLPYCLWYSSSIPLWVASSLLLTLFAQPGILGSSTFLGWAGGPWGRDHFNTLDLWSGTLLLSLSGIGPYSLLLSQNWKHTSSLLYTDLLFSLISFNQPITSNACVWGERERMCVFMCVCVCVHVW